MGLWSLESHQPPASAMKALIFGATFILSIFTSFAQARTLDEVTARLAPKAPQLASRLTLAYIQMDKPAGIRLMNEVADVLENPYVPDYERLSDSNRQIQNNKMFDIIDQRLAEFRLNSSAFKRVGIELAEEILQISARATPHTGTGDRLHFLRFLGLLEEGERARYFVFFENLVNETKKTGTPLTPTAFSRALSSLWVWAKASIEARPEFDRGPQVEQTSTCRNCQTGSLTPQQDAERSRDAIQFTVPEKASPLIEEFRAIFEAAEPLTYHYDQNRNGVEFKAVSSRDNGDFLLSININNPKDPLAKQVVTFMNDSSIYPEGAQFHVVLFGNFNQRSLYRAQRGGATTNNEGIQAFHLTFEDQDNKLDYGNKMSPPVNVRISKTGAVLQIHPEDRRHLDGYLESAHQPSARFLEVSSGDAQSLFEVLSQTSKVKVLTKRNLITTARNSIPQRACQSAF